METYIQNQKEEIGRQLKEIRLTKKISTSKVEKMGFCFRAMTAIEKGEKNYTIGNLLKYMKLLEVDELIIKKHYKYLQE